MTTFCIALLLRSLLNIERTAVNLNQNYLVFSLLAATFWSIEVVDPEMFTASVAVISLLGMLNCFAASNPRPKHRLPSSTEVLQNEPNCTVSCLEVALGVTRSYYFEYLSLNGLLVGKSLLLSPHGFST